MTDKTKKLIETAIKHIELASQKLQIAARAEAAEAINKVEGFPESGMTDEQKKIVAQAAVQRWEADLLRAHATSLNTTLIDLKATFITPSKKQDESTTGTNR